MTTPRRAVAAALVVALAAAGVLLTAVPAEAVSSFRYWSYWHVASNGSSWTYAGTGPAGYRVDDGAVEGWRFVVAVPNPTAPPPRTVASSAFDAICGSTPRPEGKDRVALVVDFGTAKDAPPHETRPGGVRGTCVVVDDRSSGLEVLAQAGYDPRRDTSGLVCGLSGFPARECGVVVKQANPTPTPTPTPSPSPTKPRPTKSASSPAGGTGSTTSPDASAPVDSPPSSPAPSGPPSSSPPPASGGAAESPPPLVVGAAPPPAGGSSSGTPLGLLLGVALVGAVGALAIRRTRGGREPA